MAASASPRNVTFNQSIWDYLVGTSEVICQTDPTFPQRKVTLPEITCSLETSFFPSPSAYKSLSFCTAPPSSFPIVRWSTARFMNHWIKPNRASNLLRWFQCFFFKKKKKQCQFIAYHHIIYFLWIWIIILNHKRCPVKGRVGIVKVSVSRYIYIYIYFFFFGCTTRFVRSQSPKQGLNPDHSSKSRVS